jgi:hypothetical protein
MMDILQSKRVCPHRLGLLVALVRKHTLQICNTDYKFSDYRCTGEAKAKPTEAELSETQWERLVEARWHLCVRLKG